MQQYINDICSDCLSDPTTYACQQICRVFALERYNENVEKNFCIPIHSAFSSSGFVIGKQQRHSAAAFFRHLKQKQRIFSSYIFITLALRTFISGLSSFASFGYFVVCLRGCGRGGCAVKMLIHFFTFLLPLSWLTTNRLQPVILTGSGYFRMELVQLVLSLLLEHTKCINNLMHKLCIQTASCRAARLAAAVVYIYI